MHEAVEVLDAYNKINDSLGLPENYENPDKMEELLKEQGDLQDKIESLGAWDIETKLNIAMDALRCPEPDTKISVLSGGERRRVALCRLLLQEPEILLLDEPTASLDIQTSDFIRKYLVKFQKNNKSAILITSHNLEEIKYMCDYLIILEDGKVKDFDTITNLLKKEKNRK